MRNPLTFLQPMEARAILLFWAALSVGVLLLASAAMSLPVNNSSPWTAVVHAPPLARWDSVWYRSIAVDGYSFDPSVRENNVGFYPLYPIATRLLSRALRAPLLPTGIALSIACLGGALLLIGDLFVEWGGSGMGLAGSATLLLYPTAFFLAAFYTESMFLLFAVAALWGARRERWLLAGAAGFCACLTRFNGFLLVPAIAAYAVRGLRTTRATTPAGPMLAAAIALAGAAAFPIYLWRRFGDPLLYVRSKIMGWPVRPGAFWALVRDLGARLRTPEAGGKLLLVAELLSAAIFLVLTAALFRRRLIPEGIFCGGTLLLLFTSGTLDGIQRYVLVLFPCFFPLTRWLRTRPALAFAYAFLGTGVGMVFLHRYVHWIFVG